MWRFNAVKAQRSVETTTRVIYDIDLPCVIGDVRAVIRALEADGVPLSYDDSALVESDGETIRISYIERAPR